jgi:anti-sigma factor RsiW
VEIVNHISEEALAQYARWSLPRLKIRLVEEHLLICSECQNRRQMMDEYVAAMRSAAGRSGRCMIAEASS